MAQPKDNWQALLETPNSLKPIQKFIKIANDVERLDPVIAYWTRFHAVEVAFQLDKNSPEAKAYLSKLLVPLENFKQANKGNEKVSQNVVAQANFENFVFALFNKADSMDRAGNSNLTHTVKMFFMASVLLEVLSSWGQLSEEVNEKIKYSKFKAAYIQKCIKSGETPKPGPFETPDSTQEPIEQASNQAQPLTPVTPAQTNFQNSNKSTNEESVKKPFEQPPPKVSGQGSSSGINTDELKAINGEPLTLEDVIKSQKYVKFANASLSFNDIKNTVANLEKALRLLKTGSEDD